MWNACKYILYFINVILIYTFLILSLIAHCIDIKWLCINDVYFDMCNIWKMYVINFTHKKQACILQYVFQGIQLKFNYCICCWYAGLCAH